MADIVNLRTARKALARLQAAAKADANRLRFGRSKAERAEAAAEAKRADRLLDGARRDPD